MFNAKLRISALEGVVDPPAWAAEWELSTYCHRRIRKELSCRRQSPDSRENAGASEPFE